MSLDYSSTSDFADWIQTERKTSELSEFFEQNPAAFAAALQFWNKEWHSKVSESQSREIQKLWDQQRYAEIDSHSYYPSLGTFGLFEDIFSDPVFDENQPNHAEHPQDPFTLEGVLSNFPEIDAENSPFDTIEAAYVYRNTETNEQIFVLYVYGLRLPDKSMLAFHAWRLANEAEQGQINQLLASKNQS